MNQRAFLLVSVFAITQAFVTQLTATEDSGNSPPIVEPNPASQRIVKSIVQSLNKDMELDASLKGHGIDGYNEKAKLIPEVLLFQLTMIP